MLDFRKDAGYLVSDDYQWFPVAWRGSVDESQRDQIVEFVSALGRRSVFERGVGVREWSVSGDVPWEWARNVVALSRARARRFYWVSPLGKHTNMLPDSRPAGADYVGMREVDGYPVETYSTTGAFASEYAPVQPGTTVTGSAYIAAGTVQVDFYKADGTYLSSSGAGSSTGGLGLVQTNPATVPDNAVSARVVSKNAGITGEFSLWMNDKKIPVGGASECAYVTLHDVQVGHKTFNQSIPIVSLSFKLVEVG